MVRALVERLPVMVTPRWVSVPAQPIAIDDIMREYARQRGLRRLMIPVPVLTPRLSSLWLGLVTPLYARVGRKLIDSIRHPTVVRDDTAVGVFGIRPVGLREAIASALRNEDREYAATRWSDALSAGGPVREWGGVRFGSRLVDSRLVRVAVAPAVAFAPIRRIGGATGWYYAGWLRLPGRARLEFEVTGEAAGSIIRQTAVFDPVGLGGLAYWYLVWPLHQIVFTGMLQNLAGAAAAPSVPHAASGGAA